MPNAIEFLELEDPTLSDYVSLSSDDDRCRDELRRYGLSDWQLDEIYDLESTTLP